MSLPELILVIVSTLVLWAIFIGISIFYNLPIELPADYTYPDISDEIYEPLVQNIPIATKVITLLALLTTPIACLCAATNNRLALPIRLLIFAENVNKFVYALIYGMMLYCGSGDASGWTVYYPERCSDEVAVTLSNIFIQCDTTYRLMDITQYCQLLVSFGRFMAVSFDGFYFRYTLRWPLAQLAFPYLFKVSYVQVERLLYGDSLTRDGWVVEGIFGLYNFDYLSILLFLACALDFVTNRKLRKMKQEGRPASKAERLLMIQMIVNSICIFTNTIIFVLVEKLIGLFSGWKLWGVYYVCQDLLKTFLLNFLTSIICITFLMKRKEKQRKKATIITVSGALTTRATQA